MNYLPFGRLSLVLLPSPVSPQREDSGADEENDAEHDNHARFFGGPVLALDDGSGVPRSGAFDEVDRGHFEIAFEQCALRFCSTDQSV